MSERTTGTHKILLVCALALVVTACAERKVPGPAADHRALNDQSAAYNAAGQFEQALAAAEQAIAARPDYSFAWNNKANE